MKNTNLMGWMKTILALTVVFSQVAPVEAGIVPEHLTAADRACAAKVSNAVDKAVKDSGIIGAFKEAGIVDEMGFRMMKPKRADEVEGANAVGPCPGLELKLAAFVYKNNREPVQGTLVMQSLNNIGDILNQFAKVLTSHLKKRKPIVPEGEA